MQTEREEEHIQMRSDPNHMTETEAVICVYVGAARFARRLKQNSNVNSRKINKENVE